MLLLLLAACSDSAVGKFNGAPSAAILSHEDGDSVLEGSLVTLSGVVSDPDSTPDQLAVTWLLNGSTACEATPDAEGNTSCALTIPSTAEVTLEVRDNGGAAASDKVTLDVVPLEAPVVTITGPASGAHLYSDQPVSLTGVATDADDDADTLAYAWTDGDSALADGSVEGDGSFDDVVYLAEGTHTLTVTVTDDDGNVGDASVGVDVGGPDTAPSCTIVAPAEGDAARVGDTVVFEGTVGDAEEAASALSVAWASSVDGTLWSSPADSGGSTTFTADTLSAGVHVLTLTATDEVGLACSDTVLFTVGAPPTILITLPTDGEVVAEGATLDVDAVVGDDDDVATDLVVTVTDDVDGALATLAPDASGDVVWASSTLSRGAHTLTLTVTDPTGLSASTSVRVTVDGLPTAPTVTLAPDPADTTVDLVATPSGATDPEGDAFTWRYEWWVDGAVSGASTSASLPASATTRGDTWTVYVYASDGVGEGPAGSASVVIDDAPPSLTGASISPSPATAADTLTCSGSGWSDADGDADVSAVTWSIDGTTVGTGTTLVSGFARGDAVTCTIVPDDGTLTGDPVTATVVIDDAPPEVTAVTISPTSPTTTDTLTAAATGADADGDPVSFTFAWYVEGALAGTGTTLAGSAFVKGDEVYVTATPSDGAEVGTTVVSASVLIGDTAPGAPTVTLSPAAPLEGTDTLVCGVTTPSVDVDGDAVTYTMTWTVDGAAFGGTSTTTWPGDTVPASVTTEGEVWTCTVTPDDGDAEGTPASASVTIGSAAVDYTDTWTLDSAISYTCAFGLVKFNFSTMRIADSAPDVDITVSGNPGTLSGTFPTSTTVDADHTLPGTCTESYTLSGTFVDDNTLDGTFTASYAGSCFDCTSKSWIFEATR